MLMWKSWKIPKNTSIRIPTSNATTGSHKMSCNPITTLARRFSTESIALMDMPPFFWKKRYDQVQTSRTINYGPEPYTSQVKVILAATVSEIRSRNST